MSPLAVYSVQWPVASQTCPHSLSGDGHTCARGDGQTMGYLHFLPRICGTLMAWSIQSGFDALSFIESFALC